MKNNKKFMSAVASMAIASQLLPIGSVAAYAQTSSTTNVSTENQVKPFENVIDIYSDNGQDGFEISFDTQNNKLNTKLLSSCGDAKFSSESEDANRVCLDVVIYKPDEKDGKPEEVLKTFKYKGSDEISKAASNLNGQEFKYGYGMRIVYRDEEESCVKISGRIINEASSFRTGVNRQILDSCVLVRREFGLEKKQDKYWYNKDYSSYLEE